MKIILTIMCALVVLFAGGCGLFALGTMGFGGMFSAGPSAFLLIGLAVLNGAAIRALRGNSASRSGVLLALIIIDGLAVAVMVIGMLMAAASLNTGDGMFMAVPALLLALKGWLTYHYWSKQ